MSRILLSYTHLYISLFGRYDYLHFKDEETESRVSVIFFKEEKYVCKTHGQTKLHNFRKRSSAVGKVQMALETDLSPNIDSALY